MPEENRTVTTTYTAKLDQQSFNKISKDLKKQNDEQVKAAKVEKAAAREAAKALKDKERFQKKIDKAHLSALKEEKKRNKDLIKLEKTRLQIAEEQNSAARRQVGSLGDIDQIFSTFRGGGAGLGVDLGGLEGFAAVFELAEAAGQLKGAAPAATQVVKELASSIGVGGIVIGATVGIMIAGFSLLQESTRKQAEEFKKIAASFQELNLELEQGTLTTDEVVSRLEDLNTERVAEKRNLEALQAEYDNYINSLGLGAGAAQLTSNAEQARVEAMGKLSKGYR